jgi:hypothetical protein
MELILNLLWLMLALPAIWLWQRHLTRPGNQNMVSAVRALLLLCCVLVLLFPVVSATDDLHPMPPEMEEEPGVSKRIVKAAADRFHSRSAGVGFAPLLVLQFRRPHGIEQQDNIATTPVITPKEAQLSNLPSRAPPLPSRS